MLCFLQIFRQPVLMCLKQIVQRQLRRRMRIKIRRHVNKFFFPCFRGFYAHVLHVDIGSVERGELFRHAYRIDVIQCDIKISYFPFENTIPYDVFRKHGTSRTHKSDFGIFYPLSLYLKLLTFPFIRTVYYSEFSFSFNLYRFNSFSFKLRVV